ncbi:UNVERIFIED_CONTAM: hypothetical protein RMT77_015545 [Armadillidium vulgare]
MFKIIYLIIIINQVMCFDVFKPEDTNAINSTNLLRQNFLSSFESDEGRSTENHQQLSFARNIYFYLPRISQSLSEECKKDLTTFMSAFRNPSSLIENNWVLPLVDSWGKSADGVLQGNRLQLGFFDECLNVKINGDSIDQGRYCFITFGSETASESKISVESKILPLLGVPINSLLRNLHSFFLLQGGTHGECG